MKTDLNYIKTMSGDNKELICEMIDIFNDQVIEFSAEMQKLLDNKDYETLGKLAHKAKSSVAIMGMNDLAKKMKKLELDTKYLSNLNSYQGIINTFKSECAEAVKELKEYQNQLN